MLMKVTKNSERNALTDSLSIGVTKLSSGSKKHLSQNLSTSEVIILRQRFLVCLYIGENVSSKLCASRTTLVLYTWLQI